MIAASVDKKQLQKTGLIIVAVALLALIVVYASGRLLDAQPDGASALPAGETAEDREAYLASLGFALDTKSSVTEVMAPKEFDERFGEYNEMLKTCGFDLEPLRGETMKKYTYTVTNAPESDGKVSAVLLVHGGSVVAGHLLCEGETTMIKPLFAPAPEAEEAGDAQGSKPGAAEDDEEETPEQPEETETILPKSGVEQPASEVQTIAETAFPTE